MLMKPLKDTNYFVDDVLVIIAYIKKQLSSILNNSLKILYIYIKKCRRITMKLIIRSMNIR